MALFHCPYALLLHGTDYFYLDDHPQIRKNLVADEEQYDYSGSEVPR